MKANPKHGEHAGQSILEMLNDQLDIKYAALMALHEAEETWTAGDIEEHLDEVQESAPGDIYAHQETADQIVKHLELKGQVAGLAYAIAKFTNPYKPDLDAIRKAVAERYVPAEEGED